MTMDRHLFGDLALAVLLALPLTTIARPQPTSEKAFGAPAATEIATASQSPAEGRISLLG